MANIKIAIKLLEKADNYASAGEYLKSANSVTAAMRIAEKSRSAFGGAVIWRAIRMIELARIYTTTPDDRAEIGRLMSDAQRIYRQSGYDLKIRPNPRVTKPQIKE